jgi:small subunit ribosomal protein S8
MINDRLADFMTRIRNASMVGNLELSLPTSLMLERVAKILQDGGYIKKISHDENNLIVTLNDQQPITSIKRLSKPGLRHYVHSNRIPRTRSGLGMVILSTPKGVLSDFQARKQKVGGELLCEVW